MTNLDHASDLVNPAEGYAQPVCSCGHTTAGGPCFYAAPPTPTLHDEMLAALRAAEEVLYGGAAISRTQALLMVQAAVMRAEKEAPR